MSFHELLSQSLLLLTGLFRLAADGLPDTELILLLAALLLALSVDLLQPRLWAYLPCAGFLVLCLYQPAVLHFAPLALYVFCMLPGWPALTAGLAAALLYSSPSFDATLALSLAGALVLYFKDTQYLHMRARYYTTLDSSSEHTQRQQREVSMLRREQDATLKLALMQERNRIARDIHDNVGHLLSRSILQVGAMELVTADPGQKEELAQLKQTLNTGMNAIRSSVHNIRQDAVYLDREIQSLLQDFRFCPVTYENTAVSELSLNHKYVVMTAIREALNNVMRHSNATRVAITLSEMGNSHVLLIADNGTASPGTVSHGMGLSAMEERVRALGGAIHLSSDRGYRILITLPKEGEHEHHHRG
jgi:signal transduction histidine kinase